MLSQCCEQSTEAGCLSPVVKGPEVASAEETVVYVKALKLTAHEYPGGKEGSHVATADCETCVSIGMSIVVSDDLIAYLCQTAECMVSVSSIHTEENVEGPQASACDLLSIDLLGLPSLSTGDTVACAEDTSLEIPKWQKSLVKGALHHVQTSAGTIAPIGQHRVDWLKASKEQSVVHTADPVRYGSSWSDLKFQPPPEGVKVWKEVEC